MNDVGKLSLATFLLFGTAMMLLLTGCKASQENNHPTVIIFAAASTTNALTDIAAAFTAQTGIEVITNFAGSSTLAQQIESGAEADVYLSANQKWADYLEEKQFCQSRTTLLGNRIVIIAPAGSPLTADSPEALLADEIQTLAMGDPAHVPAGRYGKQALETLGLWAQIEPKVSAAKDVRSALAYVETQAAEAGIVYATDAAISDKVKVIYQFPEDATAKPIAYPAMILNQAPHPKAAQQFFEYLDSSTARTTFSEYGFITQ